MFDPERLILQLILGRSVRKGNNKMNQYLIIGIWVSNNGPVFTLSRTICFTAKGSLKNHWKKEALDFLMKEGPGGGPEEILVIRNDEVVEQFSVENGDY